MMTLTFSVRGPSILHNSAKWKTQTSRLDTFFFSNLSCVFYKGSINCGICNCLKISSFILRSRSVYLAVLTEDIYAFEYSCSQFILRMILKIYH
jgi:hypothetical protein